MVSWVSLVDHYVDYINVSIDPIGWRASARLGGGAQHAHKAHAQDSPPRAQMTSLVLGQEATPGGSCLH